MVDEKYQNVTISNSNAVGPLGAFAIRGIYAEVYPEAIPPLISMKKEYFVWKNR